MAGVKGATFLAKQEAQWQEEYAAEAKMRSALRALMDKGNFPTEAPKEDIRVAIDPSGCGSTGSYSVITLTEYDHDAKTATLKSQRTPRASNVEADLLRHIDEIRAKHPMNVTIHVHLSQGLQTEAGQAARLHLKAALAERAGVVVKDT
jgi:hypothetical protein